MSVPCTTSRIRSMHTTRKARPRKRRAAAASLRAGTRRQRAEPRRTEQRDSSPLDEPTSVL
eukprot:scaffold138314_cov130-Phaeocystis_antarctica.AAC.1